jgi:hypothetical protein
MNASVPRAGYGLLAGGSGHFVRLSVHVCPPTEYKGSAVYTMGRKRVWEEWASPSKPPCVAGMISLLWPAMCGVSRWRRLVEPRKVQ